MTSLARSNSFARFLWSSSSRLTLKKYLPQNCAFETLAGTFWQRDKIDEQAVLKFSQRRAGSYQLGIDEPQIGVFDEKIRYFRLVVIRIESCEPLRELVSNLRLWIAQVSGFVRLQGRELLLVSILETHVDIDHR